MRRSRSKTSPLSKASSSSKGSLCSIGNGKFEKPKKQAPATSTNKNKMFKPSSGGSKSTQGAAIARRRRESDSKAPVAANKGSSYRDAVMKEQQPANRLVITQSMLFLQISVSSHECHF